MKAVLAADLNSEEFQKLKAEYKALEAQPEEEEYNLIYKMFFWLKLIKPKIKIKKLVIKQEGKPPTY